MRLPRPRHCHRPHGAPYIVLVACAAALGACGGGRAPASPRPAEESVPAMALADSTGVPAVGCVWVDDAQPAPTVAPESADVAIIAHVHAQSVRVSEARGTRVGASGSGQAPIACEVRSNLPHPVQRGRTYHDVQIDLRIVARVDTARAAAPDTARPPRTQQPQPGATP